MQDLAPNILIIMELYNTGKDCERLCYSYGDCVCATQPPAVLSYVSPRREHAKSKDATPCSCFWSERRVSMPKLYRVSKHATTKSRGNSTTTDR